MPGTEIRKTELFDRLAQGHAAGITVVTPNHRLAQVLKAEFVAYQAARRLAAWEDADILPLDAFIARCYEDALYADGGALPMLLSDAQARALWEQAIRGSRWNGVLLDVPQTAASAQQAWRLAQRWRIAGAAFSLPEKFAGTEDTRAFADWARAYARRCGEGAWLDSALLPDFSFGEKFKKPELLVAYAFDVVAPQAADFFARFNSVACGPEEKQPRPLKTSFASPREELESAARWARARLEQGIAGGKPARIGVVLPELKLRRREVARVFRRVMGSPLPFELSIGEPLADYPIVACALSLIEFGFHDIEFEQASRLIRSPFLGGAQTEMAARARLDVRLRRAAGAQISLPKLIGMVEGCPLLRLHLERIFKLKIEKQSPQDWARQFTALLEAAGFPGERTLDSAEFQARARFNELLGEFARLGLVTSNLGFQNALNQLRRLCAETLFQPEGASGMGAPVQVLEPLESAGIEFDALWVSGLTDGQWPQRVRPHPFLPAALQRKAGIPEASAEASLALDRRRTEGWLRAAQEVVFSWARREEDRELSPSPLIAPLPEGNVEVPSFSNYRDLLFAVRETEKFEDARAIPLQDKKVRGGTRVLADQAACPFRAYARHRLGAEALEAPEPGLDAMQRGQLLHSLMAEIWRGLKGSVSLNSDLNVLIEASAAAAVADLDLDGQFAELEKQRLIRLAAEWLDVERARTAFEVVHIEDKRTIEIGGLTLSGRIDRMDRFLDGEMRGSHVIIDYKTGGRATPNDWMGERPEEPQLPLYVVSASENVSAVAFAKLRTGDMKFAGFSERDKVIPGVRPAKSWPGLMQYWKTELGHLAGGFAQGEARVDPKKGLATCRRCDLQPLCRVHERLSALGASEEGEGET